MYTCAHLNAGGTGESLGVAHHAHVVGVLFQLPVVTSTAIQTRQALLLVFDPTAGVATGQRLVADNIRPCLTLWIRADTANG